MTNYKPIDTKPRVQFEEDNAIEIDVTDIETEVEASGDDLEEAQSPVEVPKAPARVQHKASRSQKRIQQLAAQKREMEAELEASRREIEELRKAAYTGTKTGKESTKIALEGKIQGIVAQLRQAMTDGDQDLVITLQDDLMNAKMELAGLTAEISSMREPETTKAPARAPEVSQKALDWIEDHPAFKTDPLFHGAAMAVNNKLVKEGYDHTTDEFYEELNARLAPKFPEVFGDTEQDDVELEEDTDSSDFDGAPTDVKPKAKPSPKQTVAASARPSGKGATPPRKSEKVTLTQVELAQATRMGITPEKYALRKMHLERNRGVDGYTPIHIK